MGFRYVFERIASTRSVVMAVGTENVAILQFGFVPSPVSRLFLFQISK